MGVTMRKGAKVARETLAAPKPTITLTADEKAALLDDPPAVASRITRLVAHALKTKNPMIAPQIDRVMRRRLALSRLEFRALRAAIWEENKNSTLVDMKRKLESYMEDPTLLIGKADGHLTWIENASPEEIADAARKLPEVFVEMECILDKAGEGHPHGAILEGGMTHVRRQIIAAFLDELARREPDLAERSERVKQRLLALSPIRMRALRAAMWQAKAEKQLTAIQTKMESWHKEPAARLDRLEQHLDNVETLSARAVEEQASQMPKVYVELEEMLESHIAL